MTYPKRPAFFAHKFCRLLFKQCAANEIGAEACWLLAVVAHTEDARHYTGAVTFFNMQLAPLVGLGSADALDRVRRKAVEAGWLHYEPGAKGVAGRYWVTVPDRCADLGDGPTDESPAELDADSLADTAAKSRTNPRSNREATAKQVRNILPCPQPSPRSSPEPAAPDAGPVEPPLLSFPCSGTGPKEWHLTASKVAEWQTAYPGVPVLAECRKALQWVRDNPAKKKTAGGMTRFLGTWLSRTQDRNPTGPAATVQPRQADLVNHPMQYELAPPMEEPNGRGF